MQRGSGCFKDHRLTRQLEMMLTGWALFGEGDTDLSFALRLTAWLSRS